MSTEESLAMAVVGYATLCEKRNAISMAWYHKCALGPVQEEETEKMIADIRRCELEVIAGIIGAAHDVGAGEKP